MSVLITDGTGVDDNGVVVVPCDEAEVSTIDHTKIYDK